MLITKDIDVVYNISPEDFNKRYFTPQKPVVIRGLIENKDAGKKWSIDYFKSTMGDLDVDIYDNGIKKDGSAYTSADLKMKFGEFLSVIEKDEHTDLRMFLFNLFKYDPQLKKDFPCPTIFKGLLDNLGYTFFAGKDTTIRMHFDIDMSNILHTQIQGRKRVVLFSPEYNDLLYKFPLNTYSLVDVENPDYEKYPVLKYVRGQECILEAGDSIFIPGAYWHLMTYLDGGMSVAYRKMASSAPAKIQALLNLLVYLPIDKLMGMLLKKKWMAFKNDIAEQRANQAMDEINFGLKDQMESIESNQSESGVTIQHI